MLPGSITAVRTRFSKVPCEYIVRPSPISPDLTYTLCRAGLPQIILAQWYDLYDMAVRAEYLGIGIYGNKSVAPDIEAVEFGTAVARLIQPGKESERFRTRAKAVAEACRKAGGKKTAVDKLIEIIDGQ